MTMMAFRCEEPPPSLPRKRERVKEVVSLSFAQDNFARRPGEGRDP